MYRAAVCPPHDDGGNGLSEYRRKAFGKLWILSAERTGVYPYITGLEKPARYVGRAGGTAAILCVYICCVSAFVQSLFETSKGVSKSALACFFYSIFRTIQSVITM